MVRFIKQKTVIFVNKLQLYLTSPLEWIYLSSVSKLLLNVTAKPSSFIDASNKKTLHRVPVVEDGTKRGGALVEMMNVT